MEWGEYRLWDLFAINSSKQIFHANEIEHIYENQISNSFPYIVRTTQNNGVRGYVVENENNLNDKNTLSFAQDTFSVFYQKQKYFTGNKVKILKAKFDNTTENIMQFVTSCFQKSLVSLTWWIGSTVETIWETKIQLPTQNWQIDFDFMDRFVAELEAERLAELEAYLSTTWLRDYHLTESESHILSEFENGKFVWGKFRISELFNVIWTKSLDSNAIDFVDKGINFVGRTYTDNGVQGKIEKQTFEPNEPFTITATVIGNYKYVKFQTEPYYCSQNIDKLTPNSSISQRNKKIAYYFITNIQKFVSLYDGQQGGYKLEDIKKYTMIIPTYNSQPNYEMMETFISAIQKLVIRDVVLYADRKIAATKVVIEK